ncbi:MAG: DNA replication/repair protein RecF [Pseudomonadota bacterium]
MTHPTASLTVATAAQGGPRRGVVRLVLTAFRNYDQLILELDPAPVVLVGANGAGKTNVLEALSFLAPGRGLRGAGLAEVANRGSTRPWGVAARLVGPEGGVDIGTGLTGDGEERRLVHIDGRPASGPAALCEHAAFAWVTPAMDRLFAEGATARRRFLDRMALALHPSHGRALSAYERAMRERNALLERARSADPLWLDALEAQMAEQAVAIAAARRELVAGLARHIDTADDGVFPKARLALEGVVEGFLQGMSALAAEDAFRARLAAGRQRDAAAGRALDGAHKTDLIVHHGPKGMPARECSTGEQKALLIGLVLAHAGLVRDTAGRAPLLLLDEVAAHLDRLRRAALFETLAALEAQCWLTGTDATLFEALENSAQFFTVFDGRVIARSATDHRI